MDTLTVPPEIASLLGQLRQRTELRDSCGNPIGIFNPPAEAKGERFEEQAGPFTLEEAERIWAAEGHLPGRPLAEFWRELKGPERVSG